MVTGDSYDDVPMLSTADKIRMREKYDKTHDENGEEICQDE